MRKRPFTVTVLALFLSSCACADLFAGSSILPPSSGEKSSSSSSVSISSSLSSSTSSSEVSSSNPQSSSESSSSQSSKSTSSNSVQSQTSQQSQGSQTSDSSQNTSQSSSSSHTSDSSHTHSFALDWSYDESEHFHPSTCGHDIVADRGAHTYGEWIIEQPAGQGKEGLKKRYCTVCGYSQSKNIPAELYQITFRLNDGSDAAETKTFENNIINYVPSRDGYDFKGWWYCEGYSNGNPVLNRQFDVSKPVNQAGLVLYALWYVQPSFGVLSSPIIEVNKSTISWGKIQNSTAYQIRINKGEETTLSETINTTSYAFPDNQKTGVYTVSVRAVGDGKSYLTSEWASVIYLHKILPQVSDIQLDPILNVLTWSPIAMAESYELTITGYGTKTLTEARYDLGNIPVGEKDIKIVAKKTGFNSSSATAKIVVLRLSTPSKVSAYFNEEDASHVIYYSSVNGADRYHIYLNGNLYKTVSNSTKCSIPYNASELIKGTNSVTVAASKEDGTYYDSPKTEPITFVYRPKITEEVETPINTQSYDRYPEMGQTYVCNIEVPDGFVFDGLYEGEELLSTQIPFDYVPNGEDTTLTYRVKYSDESVDKALAPFYYEIDEAGDITITGYKDPGRYSVVVPGFVKAIAPGAFKDARMHEVVVEEGVEIIGAGAFEGCSSIVSMDLPFVGTGASDKLEDRFFGSVFGKKASGTMVAQRYYGPYYHPSYSYSEYIRDTYIYYIPHNLTKLTIRGGTLKSNELSITTIEKLEIGENVRFLESEVIGNPFRLKELVLGVTKISPVGYDEYKVYLRKLFNAFEDYGNNNYIPSSFPTNLRKVTLTTGTVTEQFFKDCTFLTTVVLEDGVDSVLGNEAFIGCTNLQSVTLPSKTETIPNNAFENCKKLTEIINFSNIKNIRGSAFLNCSSFAPTALPSTLETLGNYVFDSSGLSGDIALPATLTVNHSNNPFIRCPKITSFHVVGESESIETYEGLLYCKTNQSLVACPAGKEGTVTIKEGTLILRAYAFAETKIETVIFPSSLTEIGDNCFYKNTSLTNAEISASVTKMGAGVFFGCTSLNVVTLPALESIPSTAFKDDTSLINVIVPEGVQEIGSDAFNGCKNLVSVQLPQSLKYIGTDAFAYASSLQELIIPDSVTSFGAVRLFKGCSSLERLSLPNCSEYVANYFAGQLTNDDNPEDYDYSYKAKAFAGFIPKTLKEIRIASGTIQQSSFKDFAHVEKITLESGVTYIGKTPFEGCSSLVELTLPFIGTGTANSQGMHSGNLYSMLFAEDAVVLYGDVVLQKVTILNENPEQNDFLGVFSLKEVVFGEGITSIPASLFYFGPHSIEKVTLPSTLQTIGNSAFEYCNLLEDINLPDGLTSIGNSAFYDCKSLKSIVVPNSVTEFGDTVFYGCTALESVDLQANIKTLPKNTFYNCSSLTSVLLPTYMEEIGFGAFSQCTALQAINLPEELNTLSFSCFEGCSSLQTIHLGPKVTTICSDAFKGCTSFEGYTGGDNITSIGSSAFAGCEGMTSFTINNKITSIGASVFNDCKNLTEIYWDAVVEYSSVANAPLYSNRYVEKVNFGEHITRIPNCFFYGCIALKEVTFGPNITEIGSFAFDYCTSLKEIEIPESVTTLNSYAFAMTGITSFTWPERYTSLPSGMFSDCYQLETMVLPETLTEIGAFAFARCTKLETITIPSSVAQVDEGIFAGCAKLKEISLPFMGPSYNADVNNNSLMTMAYYFSEAKFEGSYSINYSKPKGTDSYTSVKHYIPDTLQSVTVEKGKIASKAFYGFSSLTTVVAHNAGSVGNQAFAYCTNLSTAQIDGNVSSLGGSLFTGSNKLQILIVPFTGTSPSDSTSSGIGDLPNNLLIVAVLYGKIPSGLFANKPSLQQVLLFDDVTEIGTGAFTNDTSLSDITLPKKLTSIGSSAFKNCSSIATITLPEGLLKIGSSAFQNCTSLESVVIPNTVQDIYSGAFKDCSSLTSVTLNEGLLTIGASAFENCDLKEVTIPSTVTSIGENAFAGNAELSEVSYLAKEAIGATASKGWFDRNATITTLTIGDEVESIPSYAFYGLSGIKKVVVPKSVKTIGDYAFAYIDSLEDLTLSEGLISMGTRAFSFDKKLTVLAFPDSLTSIGSGVIAGCSGLSELILPFVGQNDSSTDVGNTTKISHLFTGSLEEEGMTKYSSGYFVPSGLKKVTVNRGVLAQSAFAGNPALERVILNKGVTFDGNYTFQGCKALISVTIGEGATSLPGYCFYGCDALTDVVFPNTLVTLGQDAFQGCKSLSSINLPASISVIPSYCFAECTSLEEFSFANIISIESSAFSSTGLTNLEIPETLTNIAQYAFYNTKLTKISIPATVTSLGNCSFGSCDSLTEITLPSLYGKVLYTFFGKSSQDVPASLTKVTILSGEIIDSAFAYLTNLESVILPADLEQIGKKAFCDCLKISAIELPNTVSSIGANAFENCSALTLITIPSGVTTLPAGLFASCTNLASVSLPSGITSIGAEAFRSCKALSSLVLPTSLETLGHSCFIESGLETVTLPQGITSVSQYCFAGCTSLKKVAFSNNLNTLEYYAFSGCSKLTDVNVNQITNCGTGAFDDCIALTKLVFSDEAIKIEDAFRNCSGLTEVIIPSGQSLPVSTFKGCISLISLTIPGLNSTLSATFGNEVPSSLKQITLEKGQARSGMFTSASGLETITLGAGVTSISKSAFSSTAAKTLVFKSESATIAYTDAQNHAWYGAPFEKIIIGENIQSVPAYMMLNCASLLEIDFPEGLTAIGEYAFFGCRNLVSVILPNAVTSIGTGAFRNCTNLAYFDTGDGVENLPAYFCAGCKSLKQIVFGRHIKTLNSYAFYDTGSTTSRIYYHGDSLSFISVTQDVIPNTGNKTPWLYKQTIYYYSEQKPGFVGQYWHYVDGKAVAYSDEA